MATVFYRFACVFVVLFVIFTIGGKCHEENPGDLKKAASEGIRLDYDHQWRTLTTTSSSGPEGRDNEDDLPLPARRRRKRKRRPRPDLYRTSEDGMLEYHGNNDSSLAYSPTLPTVTKREPLVFTARPTVAGSRTTTRDRERSQQGAYDSKKRYRVPYSQSRQRYQQPQPTPSKETTEEDKPNGDLKSILKQRQSSGLSLSEVLQQRNLTLSDLIKGKRKALSALVEPSAVVVRANSAYGQRIVSGSQNEVSTELQPPYRNEDEKPVKPVNWRSKFEGPEAADKIRFEDSIESSRSDFVRFEQEITPNNVNKDEGIQQMLRFEGNKHESNEETKLSGKIDTSLLEKNKSIHLGISRHSDENVEKSVGVERTTKVVDVAKSESDRSSSKFYNLPKRAESLRRFRRPYNATRVRFGEDHVQRDILKDPIKPKGETIIKAEDNNDEKNEVLKNDTLDTEQSSVLQQSSVESIEFGESVEQPGTTTSLYNEATEGNVETSDEFDRVSEEFDGTSKEFESTEESSFADEEILQNTTFEDEREQTDTTEFEYSTIPMSPDERASSSVTNLVKITATEPTTTQMIREQTKRPEILKMSSSSYEETSNTRDYERGHILEVLNSRGGNRLQRILNERNMTLEELLDHRERGSSQLHLADVERRLSEESNRRRRLTSTTTRRPRDVASVEREVAMFENFPNFDLSSMRGVRLSEGDSEAAGSIVSVSVSRVRPPLDFLKRSRSMGESSSTTVNVLATRGTRKYLRSSAVTAASVSDTRVITDSTPSLSQYISDDQISDASNEILHVDLTGESDYKTFDIPDGHFSYVQTLGVRSAIVASSIIVGLSILIFLAILIACRWRQKSKNKLRYDNRLMFAKARIPILQHDTGSRSRLSPILISSRSRNAKLNTLDARSHKNIQEYLWKNFKKTFQ